MPALERKNAFALILVSLIVSLISAAFSGVTKDALLSPVSFSFSGGFMPNAYMVLLVLLFLPFAYAVAAIYSLDLKKPAADILLAPLIATPLIFAFLGTTLVSLVFSISLVLSVFLASNYAFHGKEHFKRIDAISIAKHAAGKGIFILNLSVAFAVFFSLYSSPAYTEGAVDAMLKNMSGFSISDISNITPAAKEQQKTASYAWLSSMENSLQNAIALNANGMTPDQQAACQNAVNAHMSAIDKSAKAGIDRQLEAGAIAGTGMDANYVNRLLNLLIDWYPAVMALTLFAMLEFARAVLLAPIAGIYGWALWKIVSGKDGHSKKGEASILPDSGFKEPI